MKTQLEPEFVPFHLTIDDVPLPSLISQLMERVIEEAFAIPPSLIPPDPARELTEREKLVIAWAAGCEVETSTEYGEGGGARVTVKTKRPVGVVVCDGRYHVYEARGDG